MTGDGMWSGEPPRRGRSDGDGMPDPERGRRDRDTVVGVFATVLYLALVVCAFGFVSLLADVDVVPREDTGRLVGPAMVATAVLAVLCALVREARHVRSRGDRPAGWSILVGLAATLGFVGVGVVLVAVESRAWFEGLVFASSMLASAFPWLVGILAVVVAIAFDLVTADASSPRPRWPWEGDDRAAS